MDRFFPISQPSISHEELAYVSDAVRSGWVSSMGKYIEQFEDEFAAYCGTEYALTTSSGTTALHLALACLGVGSTNEVVVPDLTFVATANAAAYTGARVVSVDIDEDTLCMDPSVLERSITERTKAVIPVHLYGHPADMAAINAIARKHNLWVIEDAAEAHGAEFQGRRVGSLSDCGVFSFYGNKMITCGEGGMITTNDKDIYQRAKYLRDHAMSQDRRYWHTAVGFNYRMTNLQAALGVAQLAKIDLFVEKRRQIMNWYREQFEGHAGLRLNSERTGAKNVFWMVCLEIDGMTDDGRRRFMDELRAHGVDSRPYFYPISDMPMYRASETPVSHRVSPKGINLPSFFDLSQSGVAYICQQVRACLGRRTHL